MSTKLRRRLPWIVIAVATVVTLAVASTRSGTDSTPEARASALAREIRCAECVGQSVAESNSSSSIAQRDEIARLIAAGQTDDQVRTAFVDTYGSDILLLPDATGVNSVIWVIPIAVGVIGCGALFVRLRRRNGEPSTKQQHRSTILTVTLFVIVGVGAGAIVARSSGQRLSRDSITGDIATTSRTQLDDAQELALSDPLESIKLYDKVIADDPANVEAIAYRNWTLYRAVVAADGTEDVQRQALEGLRQATVLDPKYADAWAFRGVLELRVANDPAATIVALDNFRQLIGPDASGSGVPVELVDSLYDEATELVG